MVLGFGVACLLLVAVIATAIATVRRTNGVCASEGGFEFPRVPAAVRIEPPTHPLTVRRYLCVRLDRDPA